MSDEELRNALKERQRLDPTAPNEMVMASENKNIRESRKLTSEEEELLHKYAERRYDKNAFRAEHEGRFKPFKGFLIEEQFQAYCKRSRLNLDTCSPVQVIETRRAFYGAVGQLLMYLRDDLAEESEDDGVAEMERIWQQVRVFWERQGRQ